ncbi:11311_t:CDS:2, partial [Acaulospora morrowiae]
MNKILQRKVLRKSGDSNTTSNGKTGSNSKTSGKNPNDPTPTIVVVNAGDQKGHTSENSTAPLSPASNHKSHKEEPPKRDPLNRLKGAPKD